MALTPNWRKFALLVHVTSSVGWIGAVAAFLALAVAGLTSRDALSVRAACLAMDLITWQVIVPLALLSLLSGIVSSLGTGWGLVRYYWVLIKLLSTVLATVILALHTRPIEMLAVAAVKAVDFNADFQSRQISMTVAAGAAVVALLAITALSVYKPPGATRFGQRARHKSAALLQAGP